MVVQELAQRGIRIDMGIIGEPSSNERLGDFIKIGRRGSLGGELTIKGIQGHVAYPHQSLNPIHESLGALKDLVDMKWDDGTNDFGPTTFQISNINAGTGARNVVPGFKKVVFNFRYSPASTEKSLKKRVEKVLDSHSLNYDIDWHDVSGMYLISWVVFVTSRDQSHRIRCCSSTDHLLNNLHYC
jgi:succinyl-diaminopimelate desuccinylase